MWWKFKQVSVRHPASDTHRSSAVKMPKVCQIKVNGSPLISIKCKKYVAKLPQQLILNLQPHIQKFPIHIRQGSQTQVAPRTKLGPIK